MLIHRPCFIQEIELKFNVNNQIRGTMRPSQLIKTNKSKGIFRV